MTSSASGNGPTGCSPSRANSASAPNESGTLREPAMLTPKEIYEKVTAHLLTQRAKPEMCELNPSPPIAQYGWHDEPGQRPASGRRATTERDQRFPGGLGMESLHRISPRVLRNSS